MLGGEGLALRIDVSKEEDTKRLAATTHEHFGRIDILLNNAAIFYDMELEDQQPRILQQDPVGESHAAFGCARARSSRT